MEIGSLWRLSVDEIEYPVSIFAIDEFTVPISYFGKIGIMADKM